MRRMLLVLMLLLGSGTASAGGDVWPTPVAEGSPSRFDWSELSGYWQSRKSDHEYLYLQPDFFVQASKYSGYGIDYFLSRWTSVKEVDIGQMDGRVGEMVMAADEWYCGSSFTQHDPNFRLLELMNWRNSRQIRLDIATQVSPPPNPLGLPRDELWMIFKKDALTSYYKDEGPFLSIKEADAPPWFRDLVRDTVLAGRFDCPAASNP